MPHSREVRATSHDRHDPMLVAAFAAGDLAGTDRDLASDLTRSCADCAALHEDLRAIARATTSAPPPIAARPRDFRLTPADAARLKPNLWRRLVGAVSGARSGLSRPVGVGLATIGLAGLLVGNVQLPLGSPAAAPTGPEAAQVGQEPGAAAAASQGTTTLTDNGAEPVNGGTGAPNMVPAPSAAAAPVTASSAAPGDGAGESNPDAASAAPRTVAGGAPAASGRDGGLEPTLDLNSGSSDQPFRPLNLLFAAAIALGLGLLLASRRRGRPTA